MVKDGTDKTTIISDYRWVIEEDRTFMIDPTNTTTTATCTPVPPATTCTGVPPTFGTNFHTSYMPLIATGCTGPVSCEAGQTIFDPATGTQDRKSTRLNSSHLVISYAVFCLKKKKNPIELLLVAHIPARDQIGYAGPLAAARDRRSVPRLPTGEASTAVLD